METRATNPWLKFIPVFIAVFCTIMVIPRSTKRFTTEASKPKEQAWPIQSTENKNDKLKCMEGKYVIWQPHYSGLGSNLVIGLGNAAKYAAYAQRELIIGMPAPGWMYLNMRGRQLAPELMMTSKNTSGIITLILSILAQILSTNLLVLELAQSRS